MSARALKAIELTQEDRRGLFARADLEFQDVRHAGASFAVHVFLQNPKADETTALDAAAGYAGTFVVFGHGECFGDVGHCDLPEGPADPFDRRLPHALTPANKTVTITEGLQAAIEAGLDRLTVALVVLSSAPGTDLHFARLSLVTYD